MADDLRTIITPALLSHIAAARMIAYSKTEPLDFKDVGKSTFIDDQFDKDIKDQAWPALVAMSKVGLDNFPDPLSLLPEPTSPEFTEQSFGLTLLLDQAPRMFCKGVDARWQASYFDPISQRLAAALRALPEDQRPDTPARWKNDVGASLEYWFIARFFLAAPWTHSESLENQKVALAYMEEARGIVETATGTTDPYREKRDEILADIYGFPAVYRKGPPQEDPVTFADYAFWIAMLFDIHYPIIEKFGHYPYRNSTTGRDTTAEESAWLDKIDHMGEAPPDVAKRIREDVDKGIWSPLGSGSTETK